MKRSQNLFLIGPMGAGKTTIGKQLAEILKKDFYDTDQEIESRCGASVSWIFDLEGEQGFRQREKKVIEELTELMGVVIATGGGVVELSENRSRLSARGVVIYLDTSVSQQLNRTSKDKFRPLLQVDNKKDVLEELKENRDPLYGEIADIIVQTEGKGVRQVVSEILELLADQ